MQRLQRGMLQRADSCVAQQVDIDLQFRRQTPLIQHAQVEQALGEIGNVGAAREFGMGMSERLQTVADVAAGIVAILIDRCQALECVLVQIECCNRIALPRLLEQCGSVASCLA